MNLLEIITELMPPEQDMELERYAVLRFNEFHELLEKHPIKNRASSISNSDAFWLYWLARDLEPEVIIESGAYRGFSLWLLHSASRDAKLFSFDPARKPECRVSVHYRSDISVALETLSCACRDKQALVFFDDHQDHDIRLRQAEHIGIEHVIFHDNYLSTGHSHLPIRFVNLFGIADLCFEFPPLLEHHDPMFASGKRRWLTYVRLLGGEE